MDLRQVVWDRGNNWAEDPKMDVYLRPSTLFGPEKFPEYLAQARAAYAADERKGKRPYAMDQSPQGGLVIPMPTMEGRR